MYSCLSGFPLSLSFFITRLPRVFCKIFATYYRYFSHRCKVVSSRHQSLLSIYQTLENVILIWAKIWFLLNWTQFVAINCIFIKLCHFHIILILFLKSFVLYLYFNRRRLWFVYRRVEPFRLFNWYAKLPIQSCLSSRLIALLSKAL